MSAFSALLVWISTSRVLVISVWVSCSSKIEDGSLHLYGWSCHRFPCHQKFPGHSHQAPWFSATSMKFLAGLLLDDAYVDIYLTCLLALRMAKILGWNPVNVYAIPIFSWMTWYKMPTTTRSFSSFFFCNICSTYCRNSESSSRCT